MTAEALRVAHGTVRCGICSASFNALDFLSERPVSRPMEHLPADDTITVEEFTDSEIIELSTAADAIAGDNVGVIDLSGMDSGDAEPDSALDDLPDSALEFHGTSEDLDRLFLQEANDGPRKASSSSPGEAEDLGLAIARITSADLRGIEVVEQRLPGLVTDDAATPDIDPSQIAAVLAFRPRGEPAGSEARGPAAAAADRVDDQAPFLGLEDGAVAGDLERTDEFPILVLDEDEDRPEFVDPDAAHGAGRASGAAPGRKDHRDAEHETVIPMPRAFHRPAPLPDAADADPGDDLDIATGRGQRRQLLGIGAVVLLGLLLLGQAIHFWRDDLARDPTTGPLLLGAYQWLGLEVATPTDLSAFELRQWGAASDPAQPGRLRLRASIVNRAAFAQPYPLLRLSLQDRFGTTIGTRDVLPAEYLPGGGTAAGLLGVAARADAEIVFVDPGSEAVGFELDVCLPTASGVRCASQPPRSGT